jgi:hypothetical protein
MAYRPCPGVDRRAELKAERADLWTAPTDTAARPFLSPAVPGHRGGRRCRAGRHPGARGRAGLVRRPGAGCPGRRRLSEVQPRRHPPGRRSRGRRLHPRGRTRSRHRCPGHRRPRCRRRSLHRCRRGRHPGRAEHRVPHPPPWPRQLRGRARHRGPRARGPSAWHRCSPRLPASTSRPPPRGCPTPSASPRADQDRRGSSPAPHRSGTASPATDPRPEWA